jgi:hypothetical protein
MLAELNEVVNTLHDVHDQMKRRLMLDKEFRALMAIEKSIALLSHVSTPSGGARAFATIVQDDMVAGRNECGVETLKFNLPRPPAPH